MSEKKKFNVEVGKVLDIMINSLYTNKEVVLRELVSNASDACDKLRYLSLTDSSISTKDLKVILSYDKDQKTFTIEDNGLGMNEDDLVQNLGTIAKSGAETFIQSMQNNDNKERAVELIGQFGVGFYSAFMVANKVKVISRKYNNNKTFSWTSEGRGEFVVEEEKNNLMESNGTKIILFLKDGENDFLDQFRIRHIISTYSDHINLPVELIDEKTGKGEVINSASALWSLSKSEINKEQYNNFYKNISHMPGEPWMTLHNKAEGIIEYTSLLFIPDMKTFDLYHPDRQTRVKLYVKKVFISEELNMVPRYLRFVYGVVDSSDLPLNISRETLQHNIKLQKIKNGIVKKILAELKKKSEAEQEEYLKFWNNFGPVLKEGLCESNVDKETILDICRFYSSKSPDKPITLQQYISNMKESQKDIFYLTGESIDSIKSSPQLEGFLSKDIEVLYLCDSVDDFWVTTTNLYKDKKFTSATRADIDLENLGNDTKDEINNKDKSKKNDKPKDVIDKENEGLIKLFNEVLKGKIKEARISKKLSSSPVCLAVGANDMDIRMEQFLIEQKQLAVSSTKILEINPNHNIIKSIKSDIADSSKTSKVQEVINTLYDQACILEGESIKNPREFVDRINKLLELKLAA